MTASPVQTLTAAKLDGQTISGQTTTYIYDQAGNLHTTTTATGSGTLTLVTTYTYDSLNRLLTLVNQNGSSTTLSSYTYTLDDAGRRTDVTEVDAGGNQRHVHYSYDNLDRLMEEKVTTSGGSVVSEDQYGYDLASNRTVTPEYTYTYNGDDQLTYYGPPSGQGPAVNYLYDANGSQTDEVVVNGPDTVIATYDDRNRMVSSTDASNATTTYSYDDDGGRASMTAAGVTTRYEVDDHNLTGYPQVVAELSSSLTLQAAYAWGLQLIAQDRSGGGGGGERFYLYDGHGSVRALANAAAVVTDTYTYDAFGQTVTTTGSTVNAYQFAAMRSDGPTGMYYDNARYYIAPMGRFNQADPPGNGSSDDPISLHRYLYANSDPVNGIDPTGHDGLLEMGLSMTIDAALDAMEFNELVGVSKAIYHALSPTPVISPTAVPAQNKVFAELCADAYRGISKFPNSVADWTSEQTIQRSMSFQATLYSNPGKTAYVLAFRGTTGTFGDWYTNIAQGALGDLLPTQYDEAVEVAKQVDRQVGAASLTMVGHSLGGGLADAAALATNRPAVTFNAAGLSIFSQWDYGAPGYSNSIVNYSVVGELLTTLQEHSAMPEAFGQQFALAPAPMDQGAGPVALHEIDAVLDALGMPRL